MKKKNEKTYVCGLFSSLIILFILAFLIVFPNLWDNFASSLNPVIFKAVPFAIIIMSLIMIFCLSEGISLVFYLERKGERVRVFYPFCFFMPKSFFRLCKFYLIYFSVKLIIFLTAFLPVALIVLCAFLFLESSFPAVAVIIMGLAAASALIIFLRFYAETSSLLFLSKYIFFENQNEGIRDILKESCKKSRGKGGKLKSLRQGFFLSFLSCVFLIPVPFVLTNYKYALSKKAYELMKR